MPTRLNQIFQLSTGTNKKTTVTRTGGWQEGLWHSADNHDTVIAAFERPGGNAGRSPKMLRLGLMPEQGVLIGYRLQTYQIIGTKLIPTGGARVIRLGLRGTWVQPDDAPQLALECRFGFQTSASRITARLSALPNDQCQGGEFHPSGAYNRMVEAYFASLADAWGSILIDRTELALQKINQVSDAGVVSGLIPLDGFAAGDTAVIRASLDECRRRRGGRFLVSAVNAGLGTITLSGWPWGLTNKGTVYRLVRNFFAFSNPTMRWEQVVERKVGAPFARFRGRSKRRML